MNNTTLFLLYLGIMIGIAKSFGQPDKTLEVTSHNFSCFLFSQSTNAPGWFMPQKLRVISQLGLKDLSSFFTE